MSSTSKRNAGENGTQVSGAVFSCFGFILCRLQSHPEWVDVPQIILGQGTHRLLFFGDVERPSSAAGLLGLTRNRGRPIWR